MDLLYVAQDENKTGTASKIIKARFKNKFILDNCLEQHFYHKSEQLKLIIF